MDTMTLRHRADLYEVFCYQKKEIADFLYFLYFLLKTVLFDFSHTGMEEGMGFRVQFDRLIMACFFEETMGTDCALENDWVVSTEHELVGRTNINILSQEIR